MLFIIFSFFSYQNLLVILPFKLLDLFLFYDNFWLDPDNLIESGKLGSGSGILLLRHSNTLFGDRIPPQIWTAHGCTRFTITVLSLHDWLIGGKTFLSQVAPAGRVEWTGQILYHEAGKSQLTVWPPAHSRLSARTFDVSHNQLIALGIVCSFTAFRSSRLVSI